MTLAAVKDFQRSHNLAVTGVVNHRTWRALNGRPQAAAASRARPARASRSSSRSTVAELVLREAARQEGKPYQYGAAGPAAFDCSGFTGYVFRQVGIELPRTSRQQRDSLRRISADEAQPGDLLFSHDSSGRVYHVAIYAGDGMIWDSSRPGERVAKRRIWTDRISFGRPV